MFTSRKEAWLLAAPAALVAVAIFILPVVIFLREGFTLDGRLSLAHFLDFWDGTLNRQVFWRSLKLAVMVTGVAAIIGYATAISLVTLSPKSRGRFLGVIILPLMVSPVARTYAWIVILGRTGIVNKALMAIGLSDEPVRFLFTETAVFIGLLQLFLPLMILPLVSAMENLPRDVVPAARVLGAGWPTIFVKIILPLTREGLVVGGTLVFVGSLSAFITPAILGGSKVLMLETLLYQKVNVTNDMVSAAVIATILILMSFGANLALKRLATARRTRTKAPGL